MSLTARTPPVGAISDVEKVACLVVCAVSALCCVAVIVCVSRANYLGIIDVLEQWGGMKWPMQGAILKFFFRYVACGRWYNPDGITAVPPDDYAARFEEFLLQEVLGVDAPAPRARTWSPFW